MKEIQNHKNHQIWKQKLYNGEKVPVFFQKDGKVVKHFGLSYLYKLPYSHSIKDGIYDEHFNKVLDLSKTIFGYIDGKEALKGRVQFSHFKAVNQARVLPSRKVVLGTPRASYYPNYIFQSSVDFKTYMDGNFKIAGRKRYPIHKSDNVVDNYSPEMDNVSTTITPLDKGVVFEGKVRFHNLKKVEIGAILSALTFHNCNNCYHNIGMAKSLGYGKIELEVGFENKLEYMREFELLMSGFKNDWLESEQLKELFSMAIEQNNQGNSKLEYMVLEEFAKNKSKTKDFLKRYTKLNNIITVTPTSLLDETKKVEFSKLREEYLQKEKMLKEKQEQKEKYLSDEKIAKESENKSILKNFINKYPNSEIIEDIKDKLEKIIQNEEENQKKKLQEEIKNKWENIHNPANKKYLKDALQNFIEEYPTSNYIQIAKSELQELEPSKQSNKKVNLDDLKKATDGKQLKKLFESLDKENIDLEEFEKVILEIYRSLKGKKQKNFFKEAQIGRFLNKEIEDKIKSMV